jgi:hypothetical protein
MTGLHGIVPAGVVTGDNLLKLMTYCRDHQVNAHFVNHHFGRKSFFLWSEFLTKATDKLLRAKLFGFNVTQKIQKCIFTN